MKYEAIDALSKLLAIENQAWLCDKLCISSGTVKRWISQNKVPEAYFSDLNRLLPKEDRFEEKTATVTARQKDQFYTTKEISKYCFDVAKEVLQNLEIDANKYTFIEPSAGCCNFYELLPKSRRIGIDIEPKGPLAHELKKKNYLDFTPTTGVKYIVMGNPPFGLRGNLALRFINHSAKFADVVAFILPPLFDSTGKGVPMSRVVGYKLAHSEKLPLDSFVFPNGKPVAVGTVFQVWTKVNTDKIKTKKKKTCNTIAKVYSLSNGLTAGSKRNVDMLNACDVYLPSTCFSGMRCYSGFRHLPNGRGYGIVFTKHKTVLKKLFMETISWEEVAFVSTNSALNLRSDLILDQVVKAGYFD